VIRILIVDDHRATREPLAMLLELQPDCTVVGQAGSIAEAEHKLSGVDVAVVDLNLPDGSGIDLIRALSREHPETVSLLLTASHNRTDFALAVEAGAEAVINKSTRTAEIIDTIRRLAAGERVLSADEMVVLLRLASLERELDRRAEQVFDQLTPREREILQSLADGLSDKQIAEQLSIAPRTVSTHMSNILGKLKAESRLQALVLALRYGVIRVTPARTSGPDVDRR
jgi:RNA polymerase sigma factor (sigma-70 family)